MFTAGTVILFVTILVILAIPGMSSPQLYERARFVLNLGVVVFVLALVYRNPALLFVSWISMYGSWAIMEGARR